MMEQAHAGEGHGNAVLVGGGDDVIITDGATGLGDVLHAALAGALHVVAEGEECIAAHGHAGLGGDPRLLLLCGQRLRLDLEAQLPHALSQNILVLVGGVDIDGVVAVGAADTVDELQGQYFGMLAHVPVVRRHPRRWPDRP